MAARIEIPFYLIDVGERFRKKVVDPFVLAYAAGRTPNPCLACNRHIRFGYLLDYALRMGASFLATGHYARVSAPDADRHGYRLLRGADVAKDQSYVLHMLQQGGLAHVRFPLEGLTKVQVRNKARAMGLSVADREESQDLCFVGGGDYRSFLRRHAPQAVHPGPIVNLSGRRLGTHKGLALYTIGQRKGLGVAATEPLYVLAMHAGSNTLVVGPEAELGRRELTAGGVSFTSGNWPTEPLEVTAKVRYRARDVEATVWPLGYGRVRVTFDRPVRDITAGQAAVFYQGDECLGGGIVE